MSISEMPPPPSGAPAPSEDEALVSVILEVVVTGLPELLKQDPAFKAALLEALGMGSGGAAPVEGEEDIDALLEGFGGEGEGDDEDIDALLEGFEGVGDGADFENLG
jgi:hypothetical protein